jgi:zinc protease
MTRRAIPTGCCFLLLLSVLAHAEPVVRTFANGLTAVVEEDHSAPVAAVRFYVRAGSMYEQEFLGAGITHLLEHVISHGSKKRTAEEIDQLQESLGNQTNAYTSTDETCYWITGPAARVDEMVDMVADYVFNPLLDARDVDTQKGVILREMAMGEDDPGRKIRHLLSGAMFRVSPARYRIIGYPDRFNALTHDDVVRYHQRMYSTDNVVAVVVGDVDAEKALAAIEKSTADVNRRATPMPALPQEPAQTSSRRAEEIDPSLSRAYLTVGYRSVNLFSPDMYPLDVAASILGGGTSSRMVARLRDEQGLVDAISCGSYTPAYDAGQFVVMAITAEEKLPAAERAIVGEIERIRREPVSAAELARAKKQVEAALVYDRASVESRASTLGSNYLATGDVHFGERYLEGIRKVTADQVLRAARQYLRSETQTVAIRRAGKTTAAAGGSSAKATIGRTTRQKLANGITLLVCEDKRAPMVSLQASFLGGLRYETDQTAGIGRMTASLMDRGTKTRTREQIAQTLDGLGAGLDVSSGRNSLLVTATCLSADLERIAGLMADCVRNPIFPPQELERVRQLQLAAIAAEEDDPDAVTSRMMLEELFPAHPYRLDPLGTQQSVTGLTREQILAHHGRLCRPQGMVLGIYGDVTVAQARALAEKLYGDWQAEAVAPLTLAAQTPVEPRRQEKVRDQAQGVLFMGFLGPTVKSEDRFALDVLDAAFSGISYPGGRLHNTLREAKLVYGTHMQPVAGLEPGYVTVLAATEPEKLGQVEEIIRRLITEVQTDLLKQDEFLRGQQMCIAAQQVELGTAAGKLQTESLDELYGLGFEQALRYAEQIQKVTPQQVREVARKYLDLDHCVVAITRPSVPVTAKAP